MAKRIAVNTLQASTIDIINTIRANASEEYQSLVPEIAQATDIPRVGEVLMGYPALANHFVSALVNRIAMVRIKSATFNNAYAELKKGYLEFGETVEEVFVNIAKAREFSAEKAKDRELRRTLPDVRTAFHAMNWQVQYPVTVQNEDLRMAFLSVDGVTDLIAKIVSSVTVAAEYDEYLLFKYLIIKAVAHGKMYPVKIGATMTDAAVQFRGKSNGLTFMNTKYNATGVHTVTDKADQYIFMDADYNASYDVNVLAGAFNMDKADFMGKLKLIDDFTTFDNERFDVIRANSDMIEEVTAGELALMADVKAVLVDKEWFQVYDNLASMSEVYVSSGLYWNYNYNVWKTVSSSPFSNAIVFVADTATTTLPATLTVEITDKSITEEAITLTLGVDDEEASVVPSNVKFVQTEALTGNGIAIHPYGAVLIPASKFSTNIKLVAELDGTKYEGATNITSASNVGATVTLNKVG